MRLEGRKSFLKDEDTEAQRGGVTHPKRVVSGRVALVTSADSGLSVVPVTLRPGAPDDTQYLSHGLDFCPKMEQGEVTSTFNPSLSK